MHGVSDSSLSGGGPRTPGAGWLGLEPRTIEVDRQALSALPDGAVLMMVEARSPAWLAGMRSDDILITANDVPFEDFVMPAIGAEVRLQVARQDRGRLARMHLYALVGRRPRPRKPAVWTTRPRIKCGVEVTPKQRPEFAGAMSAHPHMSSGSFRILMRLMFYYDGRHGAFPSYATLARDCRCSRRRAIERVKQLQAFGVLDVGPKGGGGRADKRTNRYRITWPDGWGRNVVKLATR